MEKSFFNNIDVMAEIIINASFFLFLATLAVILFTTFSKSKHLEFSKKLIFFTACLTISIWSLQFLADYVSTECPAENLYELLAFSFYHALKSFGADDNLLVGIREVLTLIPSHKHFGYRIFVSILAFCAPITSATIFFEILANFFPKVKLFILRMCLFKKIFYFNKLNERSLALAKDILKTEKTACISPAIVFTDVYSDYSEEKISELLAEAKALGAICLRDDIIHIKKSSLGNRKFFLIDEDEIVNLQTFTKLSDTPNYKSLKKSEIYLFCQDYIYSDVENQVRAKLEKQHKLDEKDLVIIPVQGYRNLITGMLEKTPLFEPIVHNRVNNPDAELSLNVTIIGIGDIGTEMLLTTYWIGQMLNCKLNITVISKEEESAFWGKLDYINPEIQKTLQKENEILRVYNKGRTDENGNVVPDELNFSEPYANIKYISCDVESENFKKFLEGEDDSKTILDTHYFLISLGSDQMNLSVANTLKSRIGKYHIENNQAGKKSIINYVVYNAALSKTLNTNNYVYSYDADKPDIFMQAVGGIEQIYTAKNIFMSEYIDASVAAAKDYDSKQNKEYRASLNQKRREKGEYEYWSNLALRLHFKYKAFSANLIDRSIFDDADEYDAHNQAAVTAYKLLSRRAPDINFSQSYTEEELKFQHSMQWLEHRRWCAFLRSMGYRCTKNYESYLEATQTHKQTEMKLHPCLVECDKNGIHGKLDAKGEVELDLIGKDDKNNIIVNASDNEILNFDLLDQLTCNLGKLKLSNQKLANMPIYDFKKYDYPNNIYLDYL